MYSFVQHFIVCVLLICRYGKNIVPVDRAAEGKVACAKALELVGFTTRDRVPRWCVGFRVLRWSWRGTKRDWVP
jgi:hypothetical protein